MSLEVKLDKTMERLEQLMAGGAKQTGGQDGELGDWKNMSDKEAAQIISDYRNKLDTAKEAGVGANNHISTGKNSDMSTIIEDENQPMKLRQALMKYENDPSFAHQLNGSNSKGDSKDLHFDEIDQNIGKFDNQTLGGADATGGAGAATGVDKPKPNNAYERINENKDDQSGKAEGKEGEKGGGIMEKMMEMFMQMMQVMMQMMMMKK